MLNTSHHYLSESTPYTCKMGFIPVFHGSQPKQRLGKPFPESHTADERRAEMQTRILMAPNLLPLPNIPYSEQKTNCHGPELQRRQTRRFKTWATHSRSTRPVAPALPHLISLISAFVSPKLSQVPGLTLLGPEGGRELPRASGHPFN